MIGRPAVPRPAFDAYGAFGGRFVSELLMPALEQLDAAVTHIVPTAAFQDTVCAELSH